MTKWRKFSVAATLLVAIVPASAQEPSLDTVLKRSASYIARFRQQLSSITAEETYVQTIVNTRFTDAILMTPTRRLKSDLLLIRTRESNRYVELRDVFEVDGRPVRDRQARLEQLIANPTASAELQIADIIRESARYNIGGIQRNINTPLMALQFLDAENQPRFRYKHVDKPRPVFGNSQDRAANDAPVFRVTTEMWTIEYEERGRNTIIRRPDGGAQPAHGRFWVDPDDGSVLISELITDGGGIIATITVSYQSEPLMGFLVPVEMRESYVGRGERITGEASYGKFRPLQK